MRGDGGTPRGLRAQQTNSREAGGTTSNPSCQTQPANAQLKRRRSQHQAPMPLRPADQYKTIRRAKTNRQKTRRTAAEPNKSDAPSKIPARYQRKVDKAKQNPLQSRTAIKTIQHHPIIKPSNTIQSPKPSNTIQLSNYLTPSNHLTFQHHPNIKLYNPTNHPIQLTNQTIQPSYYTIQLTIQSNQPIKLSNYQTIELTTQLTI